MWIVSDDWLDFGIYFKGLSNEFYAYSMDSGALRQAAARSGPMWDPEETRPLLRALGGAFGLTANQAARLIFVIREAKQSGAFLPETSMHYVATFSGSDGLSALNQIAAALIKMPNREFPGKPWQLSGPAMSDGQNGFLVKATSRYTWYDERLTMDEFRHGGLVLLARAELSESQLTLSLEFQDELGWLFAAAAKQVDCTMKAIAGTVDLPATFLPEHVPLAGKEALANLVATEYAVAAFNYMAQRNDAKAVQLTEYAVHIAPSNTSALNAYGLARYKLGNARGAVADLTRSIEIQPSSLAYGFRGLAQSALGAHQEARADLDEAIALEPGQSAWHQHRGTVLHRSADFAAALEDYDLALRLNPSSLPVLKGLITAARAGQPPPA